MKAISRSTASLARPKLVTPTPSIWLWFWPKMHISMMSAVIVKSTLSGHSLNRWKSSEIKTRRKMARAADVPVVLGSDGLIEDVKEAKRVAAEIGFPVLIKATAGGVEKGCVSRNRRRFRKCTSSCPTGSSRRIRQCRDLSGKVRW